MKKPHETKTFHYHNQNPKGLKTGDCRIRAVSLATGVSWEIVVLVEALLAVKTGKMEGTPDFFDLFMQEFGHWEKHKMPKHQNGKRYKISQLAVELKNEPNPVVVTLANHVTCIKDGKIWDTWDCGEKCVGNYWTLTQ